MVYPKTILQSTVANTTDHEIVIAKGPLISILTNRGSSGESGSVQIPASAGLPQVGQVVDVLTVCPSSSQLTPSHSSPANLTHPCFLASAHPGKLIPMVHRSSPSLEGPPNSSWRKPKLDHFAPTASPLQLPPLDRRIPPLLVVTLLPEVDKNRRDRGE